MAEGEDQEKVDPKKGFAGLSSMVSDVDSTVAQTARESKPAPRAAPAPAESSRSTDDKEPDRPVYQAPAQSSGGSSTGKWVLGIGVVAGLLWLVSQSGDKTSSPAPAYTPSGNSSSVASPSPSWQPAPSPPPAPSRPSEERPPVGTNNVLTSAQLRYCVAEEIRLDAAKGVINNYNDTHVDRFNEMVADYNGRCGQFRYRSGALESARSEVERFRGALEADGRARFVRAKAAPSQDLTFAPVEPSPDPTVKAIQERLNTLGYDAGPADGLFGGKTRAAILAFQRGSGLKEDGLAGPALLAQLLRATPKAPSEPALGTGANRPTASLGPEIATPSARPDAEPQAGKARTGPPLGASEQPPSGMPDISWASAAEQAAIENACSYHKRNSGPSEYYSCLRRELAALGSFQGKPDLSRASPSEQAAIENACSYHRRNSGPGEYYSCLRREMAALGGFQGKPDLSRASASEQAAIENACSYHRRNSGPGEYYSCLRRELVSLSSFRGKPDLSRASVSEQAAIENNCSYHKRNSGPGEYYGCLRREMSQLGYR